MNHVTYEELLKFIRATRKREDELSKEYSAYAAENPVLSKETVIDEEKSVRWNREEVVRRNNSRKGTLAAYTAKINQCDKDINEKIVAYIRSEFDFGETIARIIFNQAYESGHHAGAEEVANYAHDYSLFAEQIINAIDT